MSESPSPRPGGIRPGIRRLFRLDAADAGRIAAEMDEEIRLHLEARAADLEALGYSAEAAREEALRRFGALEPARMRLRHSATMRTRRLHARDAFESLWLDVRYALRGLRAQPAFSFGVAATLALGLGINSAVFRLVDRLFFWSPGAVVAPAGLRQPVAVRKGARAFAERLVFSYPETRLLQESGAFASSGVYTPPRSQAFDGNATMFASAIGDEYFATLGVRAEAGRLFTRDELRPDAAVDVMLISDALWRSRFGGDSGAFRSTVDLGGKPFRIIGVLPRDFTGVDLDPVDVWIPLGAGTYGHSEINGFVIPWYQSAGLLTLQVVARTRPGFTDLSAAELINRARQADATSSHDPIVLRSLVASRTSGTGTFAENVKVLTRVSGVALLILLLAAANAMNIVLARGLRRRHETAVRLALGVSRPRLLRQSLVEAVVLSTVGAVAALVAGSWSARVLRATLFPTARWDSSLADGHIAWITLVVSLGVGLVVGAVPAFQTTRPELVDALKGTSLLAGRRSGRTRDALVVVQVALSVALLIGTGLFVRSLWHIAATDVGIDPANLITASTPDRAPASPTAQVRVAANAQTVADWVTLVRHLPGVRAAVATSIQPFGASEGTLLDIPGRDSVPNPGGSSPLINGVTPEYFSIMGMHAIAGRLLTAGDNAGSARVVVINQTMARAYWPGESPIGQCLRIGGASRPCSQIVGIVADIRERPKGAPLLRYYVPQDQAPFARPPGAVVIRAAPGMSTRVMSAVRAIGLNGITTRDVVDVEHRFGAEARPWHLGSALFGALGFLALLLAGVGLSSVLLCVFTERARELGVRIALGANVPAIARLVIATGLRLVIVGWVAGALLGLGVSRAMTSMMVGVSVADPMIYLATLAVLVLAALAAAALPARRAARLDPAEILRT